MPSDRISLLIPAFNAAATLGSVLREASGLGLEILVVDDGSSDGTGGIARECGAQLTSHSRNMGKGAALATGFAELLASGANAVITMDADGQHDPSDAPGFISTWREVGSGLIVGARLDGFEGMSPARRFGNNFSTRAVRFFGGPDLPDTQCGFRLYSRSFLERAGFTRRAYDAEAELLMLAARHGMKVTHQPIKSPDPDGRLTSHYRPWLDTYRMCRTVVLCGLATALSPAVAGSPARDTESGRSSGS